MRIYGYIFNNFGSGERRLYGWRHDYMRRMDEAGKMMTEASKRRGRLSGNRRILRNPKTNPPHGAKNR